MSFFLFGKGRKYKNDADKPKATIITRQVNWDLRYEIDSSIVFNFDRLVDYYKENSKIPESFRWENKWRLINKQRDEIDMLNKYRGKRVNQIFKIDKDYFNYLVDNHIIYAAQVSNDLANAIQFEISKDKVLNDPELFLIYQRELKGIYKNKNEKMKIK